MTPNFCCSLRDGKYLWRPPKPSRHTADYSHRPHWTVQGLCLCGYAAERLGLSFALAGESQVRAQGPTLASHSGFEIWTAVHRLACILEQVCRTRNLGLAASGFEKFRQDI